MFGPTNLDEVSVEATYVEEGNIGVAVSGESSSKKECKGKGNVKKENPTTMTER